MRYPLEASDGSTLAALQVHLAQRRARNPSGAIQSCRKKSTNRAPSSSSTGQTGLVTVQQDSVGREMASSLPPIPCFPLSRPRLDVIDVFCVPTCIRRCRLERPFSHRLGWGGHAKKKTDADLWPKTHRKRIELWLECCRDKKKGCPTVEVLSSLESQLHGRADRMGLSGKAVIEENREGGVLDPKSMSVFPGVDG